MMRPLMVMAARVVVAATLAAAMLAVAAAPATACAACAPASAVTSSDASSLHGATVAAPSLASQPSANDDDPTRTWLGWLSGFAAIGAVLLVAAACVAWIRRRRD